MVNLELERRAAMTEEEMKQKEEEMKQKEYMIAALREQVQDYESRLSECEGRMKKVEDELQKQITSLQVTESEAASVVSMLIQSLVSLMNVSEDIPVDKKIAPFCCRWHNLLVAGEVDRQQRHSAGKTCHRPNHQPWEPTKRPRGSSVAVNPPPWSLMKGERQ